MEFGTDDKTLTRGLRRADEVPGPDGLWSTLQICHALFGDLESERILLTRAQREGQEIENKKKLSELIPADWVDRAWEMIVTVFKQKLLGIAPKLESALGLNATQVKLINAEVDSILADLSQPPQYEPNGVPENGEEDSEAP